MPYLTEHTLHCFVLYYYYYYFYFQTYTAPILYIYISPRGPGTSFNNISLSHAFVVMYMALK